jgi:hypothetical protein
MAVQELHCNSNWKRWQFRDVGARRKQKVKWPTGQWWVAPEAKVVTAQLYASR